MTRRSEGTAACRVVTTRDAATCIREWQADGLTVAVTDGAFDVLHEGHLALLTGARAQADRLVVALHDDERIRAARGPERPVHPASERAELMSSLRPVDLVTVLTTAAEAAWIDELRPDVLVLTQEGVKEGRGPEILLPPGIRAVHLPVAPGPSSSDLIARIRRQGGHVPQAE